MTPHPLIFTPILRPKVWGGRTLSDWGKPLPDGLAIGESWELADLPASIEGGRSVIAKGPLAGQTLHDVIQRDVDSMMGGAPLTSEGGFPLLIKFLDARENLSVQVHPDEAYLANHPDDNVHLKSEAWIVLEAAPDAVIYKGVRPDIDRATFRAHVEDGTVVDDLIAIPARAGDCHYLPSGICHALGAGILVAEVQTPSDTTFRVYDWGRPDRDLHLDEAMECIQFGTASPEPRVGPAIESDGVCIEPLVRTEYFSIERITYSNDFEEQTVPTDGPLIWIVVDGRVDITSPDLDPIPLTRGSTTLIPAGSRDVRTMIQRGTRLLRVQLPSPLEGLLA